MLAVVGVLVYLPCTVASHEPSAGCHDTAKYWKLQLGTETCFDGLAWSSMPLAVRLT
jgi:hypothetical protein